MVLKPQNHIPVYCGFVKLASNMCNTCLMMVLDVRQCLYSFKIPAMDNHEASGSMNALTKIAHMWLV